jgi:hypothetical protein
MAPSFAFLLFGICLSVRFGLAGLVQRQSGDSTTAVGSDPTQAVGTGSAPSSFPTSPPTSQGTVITIDSSWLSDDGTTSTSVLSEGDLTVLLPPADNSNSEDFSDLNAYTLNQSLPYLLQELGVDSNDIPSLVSEAIPLFLEAILDALTGDDSEGSAAVSRFMKRSISSDLGSWISEVISKATNLVQTTATDVGCGIFAAAAVPVFDAGAALFAVYNAANTGVPTSQDQDFYIFPLYGSISHDDSIVVYYNANFIPGFANALGVTMGRNIYIRNTASSASATDPGFQATMALLLHEFTHITQYQVLGYNLDAFGARYMWEYCQVRNSGK